MLADNPIFLEKNVIIISVAFINFVLCFTLIIGNNINLIIIVIKINKQIKQSNIV